MAGQICKTCKHKNDWCYCSPNSICFDYEEDENVVTKVEDFVRYAKDEYGCEITIEKSDSPDTFKSILGECFLDDMTEEEKMKDAMINQIYVKQEPYINDEGIYVPCEDYAPEGQSVPYRCIMTKEMFVEAYNKWIKEE